jgi:hypothetical protein
MKRSFSLSFRKSPQIFGNGVAFSGLSRATSNTMNMMVAGIIDTEDGTIRESALFRPHMEAFYLQYLWSYIYYLYYINRDELSVFRYMTDEETKKASAVNFYHVVRSFINDFKEVIIFKDFTPLNKLQLATFILKVVRKYKDRLKNPVLEEFREVIRRETPQNNNMAFTIRTGEETVPEVNTDDYQKILNSDIRLVFSPTTARTN